MCSSDLWHLGELGAYETFDKVLNMISLSLLVVLPVVMLLLLAQMKGEVTYGTR